MSLAAPCAARIGLEVDFEVEEARLRERNGAYYFTLKSGGGLSRSECEREIPSALVDEFWPQTAGRVVEKLRLAESCQGRTAEVDLYTDRDLIVIEIEVETEADAAKLTALGKDVSADAKYKNKNLAT